MINKNMAHHSTWLAGLTCLMAVVIAFGSWSVLVSAQEQELRVDLLARPLDPALGGDTTVTKYDERAFERVISNGAGMTKMFFNVGQQLFKTIWKPAPGLQPASDGLGPLFHRNACSECHNHNGRGRPPETEGGPMDSMLIRLSVAGVNDHQGPKPAPFYGDQLQDRSVDGVPTEGRAILTWTELEGTYADGTKYSLRRPEISFADLAHGDLPADIMASARVGNPIIGLGLLEAVPDDTLRALADPDDQDGDGISGRVNMVWNPISGEMAVGRFGWKANVSSIEHQTAAAALGDMGITSPVFMEDHCEEGQDACRQKADEVVDHPPEIRPELFNPLVRYTMLTAVPAQRNADDPQVGRGETLFRDIGCSSCHMPTLITGESAFAELSGQVIHPFTDLLLHEMGEGLADGRPDFAASGQEWRTAPLWGIGLTEQVSGFNLFLHDGRARGLAEAILWHAGEAEMARDTFRSLNGEQRSDLITFLKSL